MITGTSLLATLGSGHIDVWVMRLHLDVQVTLSPAELLRAARRIGDERRRFVVSHAATREIVARYLGLAPESLELEMAYGERPRVAGGAVELSLAHSGELALLAVATMPVGIDVERVDDLPENELADVAAFSLSRREQRQLAALPEGARRSGFLRLWTRKEAYLKSRGEGISDRSLAEIEVGAFDEPARLLAAGDDVAPVVLIDLDPEPGYVGAVAAAGLTHVQLRRWPADLSATVDSCDSVVGYSDRRQDDATRNPRGCRRDTRADEAPRRR